MNHPKLRLSLPWEQIEESAQKQIVNVLRMPELEILAVMPDVHAGYDLCIGGVALLQGCVSPSFVGYDIGCGMCHVDTGLSVSDLHLESVAQREALFQRLNAVIPSGVGKGNAAPDGRHTIFVSVSGDRVLSADVSNRALHQLGTLGSGNHFLEVGVNAKGSVGVTVHSGSRRAGYDVAAYYMKLGRLLSLDSDAGQAYLADMDWALGFALENRRIMLEGALNALHLPQKDIRKLLAGMINENHNHAVVDGNRVLHRKGATPADAGQMGVIPANQRDGVWITRGLGNEEFLRSASHGAGRVMSRKAAKQAGTCEDLAEMMRDVVCRTDEGVLDEGPWAYKDINGVLAAQNGVMVDVVDHFKPIIVMKG